MGVAGNDAMVHIKGGATYNNSEVLHQASSKVDSNFAKI